MCVYGGDVRVVCVTLQDNKFVDFRRVRVYGGDGGDGTLSFLHLAFNEFAGPDGGNGGNGGHVIFQGTYAN